MRGRRSWLSSASLVLALAAALASVVALSALNTACTSGTTPNCDAGQMCDPYPPADAGDGGVVESSTQGG
jgi:hypothetical protein